MSQPALITTTHDTNGLSVFRDSPSFKAITPRVGMLYSTAANQPVILAGDNDLFAHEARHNKPIPTEGSVVLIAEWPPGAESPMHRTLSVDVGVMTAGEIELVLDSGESRILKQGDVMLHRGTKHGWKNRSDTEIARMICFVLPSEPIPGANA